MKRKSISGKLKMKKRILRKFPTKSKFPQKNGNNLRKYNFFSAKEILRKFNAKHKF